MPSSDSPRSSFAVFTKDVDDLLAPQMKPNSKSSKARELILDMLEASPMSMESDELDAAVAQATGVAPKTVPNQRTALAKEGLIRPRPELDEHGHPTGWVRVAHMVVRT